MFILNHEGEKIGTTMLERGEPSDRAVSGQFFNLGGAMAIAGWIKSIGGQEDNGVIFITLNEDFELIEKSGQVITFEQAHLISVPDEEEVYLDVSGVAEQAYDQFFANHQIAETLEG